MNVSDFFSKFDSILTEQAACIESKSMRRTVRLKDLVVENGIFLTDLFEFLCWLVSDNERELFFSRTCAIKFFHYQADNEMLKVSYTVSRKTLN